MGTGGNFLRLNRPGNEANQSLPSSAEVKNAWIYTSTPLVVLHDVVRNEAVDVFMAWHLVKHRYNFTFTTCVYVCAILSSFNISTT